MNRRDKILKDFEELRNIFRGGDINDISPTLKEKVSFVDSFVVPIKDGRLVYAAIDWEASPDRMFYMFYVVGKDRESSEIYEVNPAYNNKDKAIEILGSLISEG